LRVSKTCRVPRNGSALDSTQPTSALSPAKCQAGKETPDFTGLCSREDFFRENRDLALRMILLSGERRVKSNVDRLTQI
jgi:hypothetical protein